MSHLANSTSHPAAHASSRQIERVRRTTLLKNSANARTHSKKQIRKIADAIDKFGWTSPILIDENGIVLAGHGRLAAAELLGHEHVPVIRINDLSEAQKRAFVLADNRLALESGWNRELLSAELGDLAELLPAEGFDISLTGFDVHELDAILEDEPLIPADESLPDRPTHPVTKLGDVWLLGKHRICCGDAREQTAFAQLMQSQTAEMIFIDPPWNLRTREFQGRGAVKHGDFSVGSGEFSRTEFVAFLRRTLGHCADHSIDGSIHFVCIDWRHVAEMLEAGQSVYEELKNICVWVKTNAGQGSFYRSQHELVVVFKKGSATHLNNFELGQHGRLRSNVWTYAGINAFRAGRMDELRMHPTVKPVSLVADAIKDCSQRGSIVLDAFLGSGTTVLASEQTGRRAFGMEIDPAFVDVAITRWQRATGRDAVLEGTSTTFEEMQTNPSLRRSLCFGGNER